MPANPTGEVTEKRLHIPLLKDSGSLGGLISRNGSRRGMLRVTTLNGIKKCPALFAERLTCALPNGLPLSLSAAKVRQNSETCKRFRDYFIKRYQKSKRGVLCITYMRCICGVSTSPMLLAECHPSGTARLFVICIFLWLDVLDGNGIRCYRWFCHLLRLI